METPEYLGKAAVFARGFMDYFEAREDEPVPLRDCQEAGKQAVEDLGESISVAYISKLARQISVDKILKKSKRGRNYVLEQGPEYNEFWADLEADPAWGTDLNRDAMIELKYRTDIRDFMNDYRAITIHQDDPLPKVQYSYLMKKFNEGKLQLTFSIEGDPVETTHPGDMTGTDVYSQNEVSIRARQS